MPEVARSSTSLSFVLLCLACAAIAAACLAPGLHGAFILDDVANIQNNTAIQIETWSLDSLLQAIYSFAAGNGSRILPELTFAMDFWRGGMDPAVFRSTNLAIHALSTLALIGFLRSLLGGVGWPAQRTNFAAMAMALAWAIHPLQVSTVLYVVQRMQSLCTLFVLLALWSYLKMRFAQIAGERSRNHAVRVGLFWVLALASKEDAVLLPVYTLLLELTVLQFRATRPVLVKALQRGYLGLTVAGLLAYFLVVLPHYWSWGPYKARDFSSYERLLTQGRVLVMYLGQILYPLPSRMPFYYDNFEVSRSLMQPGTTLPAWLLIFVLIIIAWALRKRQPLSSFGLLFFFAGHLITSNVIGLELAFEHRNQLPMVGVILVVADLLSLGLRRTPYPRMAAACLCGLLLTGLGVGTWTRATIWGEPTAFAEYETKVAPDSVRSWTALCFHYDTLAAGSSTSPYLDKAIVACERGGKIQSSALPLAYLVLYKTRNGSVTQADWDAYLNRMRTVVMHIESRQTAWMLMSQALDGVQLDQENVIQAINIVTQRGGYTAIELITIGYYILGTKDNSNAAYQYFEQAVMHLPADDPHVTDLFRQLRTHGRSDWADRLSALQQTA